MKIGLRTKIIMGCCLPVLLTLVLSIVTTVHISSVLKAETSEQAEQSGETDKKTTVLIESEAGGNIMDALHTMVSGTVIIFIIALIAGFFLSGKFIKSIGLIIEGLAGSSGEIASVSQRVSSESRQLARDVSEQASSIEGTSSSLEQISSMTKQNADNANQADQLVNESKQIVGTANESVVELTVSMEDISKASEETSKIIKTIDEIAFQTNLLALNAAVEAARAGEAGSGFAVVADEVRNLAMRAAEAARNTSELIEGTVKRVKDGAELVTKTNENFAGVSTSTVKVGELVAEIAATSNEQARDIDQVNKAMAEMDKITRQNASNAENSASVSEEMNIRVEEMKGFVDDLLRLFGRHVEERMAVRPMDMDLKRPEIHTLKKEPSFKEMPVYKEKEIKPEQIIPLDDDDFEDF
ncbi:methyl-accepting chemotaxis protein [Desulfobacterales bacterium HSG2]|nr:methyl-accepting chemotaxis protein [Desulfobacterales bacterium HSG2]